MPESTRTGESECYFAANQPMRYDVRIVYSLEVEHCTCTASLHLSIVSAVMVTSHLEDSATSTLWLVWQHVTTGAVKKCPTITTHPPSAAEV